MMLRRVPAGITEEEAMGAIRRISQESFLQVLGDAPERINVVFYNPREEAGKPRDVFILIRADGTWSFTDE